MDRNTVIGFVLIVALVIGWTFYQMPSKEQVERDKKMRDSLVLVEKKKEAELKQAANVKPGETQLTEDDTTKAKAPVSATASLFKDTTITGEQFVTLENEVLKVTLSSKGGRVYRVELKKYTTWDKKPVVLFDGGSNSFNYYFYSGNEQVNTGEINFKPQGSSINVKGTDSASISLRAYLTPTRYMEQTYSLKGTSYLLDYHYTMVGLDSIIQGNTQYLNLVWNTDLVNAEKSVTDNRTHSTVYYKFKDEDATYLSTSGDAEEKLVTNTDWVSFKQHFFNATLISKSTFGGGVVKVKEETHPDKVKLMTAELILPYKKAPQTDYAMQFYFGPNHYQDLKKLDNGMEDIIQLGFGIFSFITSPVNKYFIVPLFNLLNNYILNYGLIILLMTILIKIILMPLTYRSLLSAARMKVIKPEIDELREKYKDDQARFGQEQLKLFQKAGVNPLGGCLPILLQLPILFAMYSFFPISIELRLQPFLWATDLSTYDTIYNFGFNVPFYGDHVSLFTLLMTATSILTAVYNNQLNSVTGQMKWMQYIFPIMLLGIFNSLPAALTYYYFLSNVITFGLQFIVQNYFLDHEAIHRQIQERKKAPPKKKSGFLARLEEMQKKQQSAQRKK